MTRPNPLRYMCGSAARINRKGASTISASIIRNRAGRELGDLADGLHAGVVDQDVGFQLQVLQRLDVEKVDSPGGSADLVGQRLGADVVDVGDRDRRSAACEFACTRRADAARTAGHQGGAAVEVAHDDRPALWPSHVLGVGVVERLQVDAVGLAGEQHRDKVIAAGAGQVDRDRHRGVVDVEQLHCDERRQRARDDRGDLIAKRDTGIAHPGREHLRHDRRLRCVHERVDHQAEGDRGRDDDVVAAVHHREGEEAPRAREDRADHVDRPPAEAVGQVPDQRERRRSAPHARRAGTSRIELVSAPTWTLR